MKFTTLALLLITALLIAACAPLPAAQVAPAATEAPAEAPTEAAMGEMADIVDTAVGAGNFTTLVAAVEAAGLVETLKGEGPFTVFAPTDDAFAALPAGTVEALLEDPQGQLTQILLYHVVAGKVMSSDLSDGMTADTVQGSPVTFTIADGKAMVNEATIVTADIETSNGVIHVIDTVILPPADEAAAEGAEMVEPAGNIAEVAAAAGNFTTLLAAVEAAGLVDDLTGEGPFTVFAPTDDAFAALPEGTIDTLLADPEGALRDILLYHVVAGKVMSSDLSDGMMADTVQGSPVTFMIGDGMAMVNEANIVTADIETSNGVIHVIDAVILPPAEEAAAEGAEMAEPAGNIAEVAASAGNFTTLLAAVKAAGLVDELTGEGPFTVFAPTDDAFAALPAGTIDSLLADPEGALRDILLYHVVAGKVMSGDLSDGMTAETLQGAPVTFTVADGAVKVDAANVVAADVEASNGVIHVIDAVILPPQ